MFLLFKVILKKYRGIKGMQKFCARDTTLDLAYFGIGSPQETKWGYIYTIWWHRQNVSSLDIEKYTYYGRQYVPCHAIYAMVWSSNGNCHGMGRFDQQEFNHSKYERTKDS